MKVAKRWTKLQQNKNDKIPIWLNENCSSYYNWNVKIGQIGPFGPSSVKQSYGISDKGDDHGTLTDLAEN